MTRGVDFEITRRDVGLKSALVIAPHGGQIEPGSSQIAKKIAGDDLGFYSFEGIRQYGNHRLHITSTNFDEPTALSMLGKATVVVAIHGRRDKNDPSTIYLGGLNTSLSETIGRELEERGFRTRWFDHPFPAKNPANICNRGRLHGGAQLEIPRTLRNRLTDGQNRDELAAFSGAVRSAIDEHL
jgi:phage replication-related protein YjqB (UPF0714/DUF867 family)